MRQPEAFLTSGRTMWSQDDAAKVHAIWEATKEDCKHYGSPRKRKRIMRRMLREHGVQVVWNKNFSA